MERDEMVKLNVICLMGVKVMLILWRLGYKMWLIRGIMMMIEIGFKFWRMLFGILLCCIVRVWMVRLLVIWLYVRKNIGKNRKILYVSNLWWILLI